MTITDNANANEGVQQQDSLPDAQAGHPPPASIDTTDPPASESDTDDQDDDDQDDGSRSNREKRYRLRLRKAERQLAERDDLIARTRQVIVNDVVDRAGYTDKVAELVAADMDALLDDNGVPDVQKVVSAVGNITTEYGIIRKSRPPRANQQQGHTSGQPSSKPSWSDAIKGN